MKILENISNTLSGTPRRYDLVLLGCTMFLLAMGIVMIFSASGIPAGERMGSTLYFLHRQCIWAFIGLTSLLIVAHIPYTWLSRLAPWGIFLAMVLLIAVQIPGVGTTRGGATRWIAMGSLTFQPSEFAKLTMILYLARYYAKRDQLGTILTGFIKPGLVCAPMILLVLLQPDFGTAVAMTALFLIISFAAGVRIKHLLAVCLSGIPLAAVMVITAPYRMRRLLAFINPWDDPSNSGYQIIQSMLAFSQGGLFGQGLGNGQQKLYFLPEPHSDFVLALIGEELGFIGVVCVILAFCVIISRGLGLAMRHAEVTGRLITVGLTGMIGLQALINSLVVTGMLPTKGITLPFVSYGGSSLLTMMTAIGLLMNISAHAPDQREVLVG